MRRVYDSPREAATGARHLRVVVRAVDVARKHHAAWLAAASTGADRLEQRHRRAVLLDAERDLRAALGGEASR